tara:strand:+ start:625 stop:1014 length:390 start_codon:yes stop_codon:yes gene_type:complete
MADQHTPGPWQSYADRFHPGESQDADDRLAGARWDERVTLRETFIVGGGEEIATLFQHNGNDATPERADANAALIAAAPDMLEALRAAERLTDYIRQHKGFLNEDIVDEWAGEVGSTLAAAIATATEGP